MGGGGERNLPKRGRKNECHVIPIKNIPYQSRARGAGFPRAKERTPENLIIENRQERKDSKVRSASQKEFERRSSGPVASTVWRASIEDVGGRRIKNPKQYRKKRTKGEPSHTRDSAAYKQDHLRLRKSVVKKPPQQTIRRISWKRQGGVKGPAGSGQRVKNLEWGGGIVT